MKGYSKYFWFIHFIGDILCINIAFILMYYLKFESIDFSDKYRFLLIIFNANWILVALMLKLYELNRIMRLDKVLFNSIFWILYDLHNLKSNKSSKYIEELVRSFFSG